MELKATHSREWRNDNPWHVKLPKDCKETKTTEHYTMEEAENLITTLVDHVDAQLVIALPCFLGLGPAEIAGLHGVMLTWIGFTSDATNPHTARLVHQKPRSAWHLSPSSTRCACRWSCGVRSVQTRQMMLGLTTTIKVEH